jgi:hypothetical protein
MIDLWTEASADHESLARQAALARAEHEFNGVFPFLAAARSQGEYAQRRAMAEERLTSIALRHGIEPAEILALADRRFALMREALAEGENPLGWIPDGGGYGSGPEEPLEHDEAADFSHGYSEVPQGAPGGPDPRVVATGGKHRLQAEGKHRKEEAAAPAPAPAAPPAPQPAPDPVRRQVMAVTASIRAANADLPEADAERLARRVVGRYLTADLTSSEVSNDPEGGQEAQQGAGGGMSGMEKAMVSRTVVKALPDLAEAIL